MSNRNARKFQHSILIEMKLIGRQAVYLTSAVRYVNIYAGGHVSKVESVEYVCVHTVYNTTYIYMKVWVLEPNVHYILMHVPLGLLSSMPCQRK